MALRFIDSFDHYSDLAQKWTAYNGSIVASGRNGTSAYRAQNNTFSYARKVLDAQATWVVGFALNFGAIPTGTNYLVNLTDVGTSQVELRFENNTGRLLVTRNGTQIGSTGTTVLKPNVWYYIEFKATINNSTGVAVVRINGVTEINLSSQDTQTSGNATADDIYFLSHNDQQAGHWYMDDLYICDGTGGSPSNDFLGDVRVETIRPSGNGNSSQFVGSDGNSTDNYLLVDETTPNDDTDYVESSTVNDKDTYAYGDLTPTAGTVFGVQVLPYARKTDAGTRTIKSVARLSGTEVDSADKTLSTSYQYLPDIREAKPGGGAWSISDVNSAEFGVKVTA